MVRALGELQAPQGADESLKVKFPSLKRLALMAKHADLSSVATWLPLCNCALAYKQPDKPQFVKTTFKAVGTLLLAKTQMKDKALTEELENLTGRGSNSGSRGRAANIADGAASSQRARNDSCPATVSNTDGVGGQRGTVQARQG